MNEWINEWINIVFCYTIQIQIKLLYSKLRSLKSKKIKKSDQDCHILTSEAHNSNYNFPNFPVITSFDFTMVKKVTG